MANADYEVRAAGSITPSAILVVPIDEGAVVINLANYSSNDMSNPAVGAGLLIGGEIMRVVSVALPLIGVARGCADTIPAKHGLGAKVWFFTMGGGADTREYMATEVIGVKVLMKSSSSAMTTTSAPPRRLAFNQRFARPYPPGQVLVNSLPFYGTFALSLGDPSLVLSWVHRDRITQNDTLHGHEVGSIGPEVGTTYRVRVYKSDDTLVRTMYGITETTASYGFFEAVADFGLVPGAATVVSGYITLHSLRDGFESWQGYRVGFTTTAEALTTGWGHSWGFAWGGNA